VRPEPELWKTNNKAMAPITPFFDIYFDLRKVGEPVHWVIRWRAKKGAVRIALKDGFQVFQNLCILLCEVLPKTVGVQDNDHRAFWWRSMKNEGCVSAASEWSEPRNAHTRCGNPCLAAGGSTMHTRFFFSTELNPIMHSKPETSFYPLVFA